MTTTDIDHQRCECLRCELARARALHESRRTIVQLPPQPTRRRETRRSAASPLTSQEQQEVLVLLRYWWEFHRGGLPMDEAVVLFTKRLLDKHAASR